MRLWPKSKEESLTRSEPPGGIMVPAKAPKTKKKKSPRKGKLRISSEVRQRFENYLDKSNRKCWGWKGSRTSDGYAQFWLNDYKVVKAHRFAFEILVRQLGKKERLRNICSGKSCLNPKCWEPFTTGRRVSALSGAGASRASLSKGRRKGSPGTSLATGKKR